MKVEFNTADLSQAVNNVQRAVATKNTIPALEGILVKAHDGKVTLCGYDLEIGITSVIDASIAEEGEIVLSAKLFADIVKKMPDSIIKLETDDKLITYLESGDASYQIIGISSYEFPELPTFDEIENISLSSETLKSMIRQTYYAVSDNPAKPVYTGSLFDIKNGTLNVVSVDGFRMAVRREKIDCDKKLNFIVPGKTLSEILKISSADEENVQIVVGKKHVVFKIENYSIVSRLIEGKFIDYEGTVPSGSTTSLKVKTKDIAASVERMSLLTNEKNQSPMRLIVADEGIKLYCTTTIGKASDYVNLAYTGEDIEIGFNNKYMHEALKNADTDELLFEFNGPLKPLKILPVDGDSFLFLVVPMRLA